jgi:hypothetical protein
MKAVHRFGRFGANLSLVLPRPEVAQVQTFLSGDSAVLDNCVDVGERAISRDAENDREAGKLVWRLAGNAPCKLG